MESHFPHLVVFDAIGEGVVVHDRETGAVLDVNDRMCEMHGYTREELMALEVEDFCAVAPSCMQRNVRRLIQKTTAHGPQVFRWLNRRKDDTVFWVEVSLRCAELEGAARVVATVRDVSERARFEAGARASEQLREVLDKLPVYVFTQDRDLRYTWVSGTITGVDPTRNVGKTDEALLPEEEVVRIRAIKERVLETGEPAHVEMQGTLANRHRFFETHLVPQRDETGTITGLLGATIDITARREAEWGEREGTERYRRLFEEAQEGIIISTPDGEVIDVNPAAQDILGFSREEFLAMETKNLYVDPAEQQKALEILAEEGALCDLEARSRRKDGKEIVVLLSSTARRGPDGEVEAFQTFFRDVTEGKKAEAALRRSERRYHRLFEKAQEGIGISTPDGEILDVNPAAERILGYSREELLARSVMDLYADPAEREEALRKVDDEGELYDHEARVYRKDGKEIILRLSLTPVYGPDGEVQVYQGSFRDVTEERKAEAALRESEERFRALAEKALVGIGMLQEEVYRYVNPALARIVGYASEDIVGRSPERLFHPDDWPYVRTQIMKRLAGGAKEAHYEARVVTREGQVRLVEIMGSRFIYQGEPTIIGTVMDITERRRLEEELLQIQEEERRRFGRELHDGVASDLTGVALIASSLARKASKGKSVHPEELEEVVEFINQGIEEARSLSRGLSPVGLERGLVHALKGLVARTQAHAELACSFETAGVLPELSEETATHLYRIAQEAIGNAVKHAEADHIEVRLTAKEGALTLVVQDDGRGHSGLTLEGEGLGMRTMRYRANLTGSLLRIEEAPNGGTRVQCQFSAHRGRSAEMNL